MMFANDIVLLPDKEKCLQKLMNTLEEFCSSYWNLYINIEITKIVTCNKPLAFNFCIQFLSRTSEGI